MVTPMTTPHPDFLSDPASIGPWLAMRRWYGDKSRTIVQSSPTRLGVVDLQGAQAALFTVDLAFVDGAEATYFVPIVQRADGSEPSDALSEAAFLAWLASGFGEDRVLVLDDGSTLTWQRSKLESAAWWERSPQLLTGEQSNTSIRFGADAVVKIFRKWQPGVNPDTEIVQYLTEHSGFTHVPAYLGGIRLERAGTLVEVAAGQTFVVNDGDCWTWLPPALAELSEAALPALLDSVGLLGQRTGELHAALAYGTGEQFAPEEVTALDAAAVRQRIAHEVAVSITMLVEAGMLAPEEGSTLERDLLARMGDATALVGTARTRVHGDYHLGQVLRSNDDFVIIDFEGEPSRPMRERREKHSPLKDVAGMLRSLDYAVATAVQAAGENRAPFLGDVGSRMEEAFLDGYAAGIADGPDWILPSEAETFRMALNLYMIEKALYETRYELDNRPDWISIPFGALQRIAAS